MRAPKGSPSDSAREMELDASREEARRIGERQMNLSREYQELNFEVISRLHADKITFDEAARMSETLSRGRDPWIRRRFEYDASFWRDRGDTTWSGKPVNREAEVKIAPDPSIAAAELARRVGL